MNKVRLTPAAMRDLAEIKRYIEVELRNPIAAAHVVGQITQALRILQCHGEAGPSVEGKTGFSSDLRMLICQQYLAFYRVEGKVVSIARILHGQQDYLRILFGDEANH